MIKKSAELKIHSFTFIAPTHIRFFLIILPIPLKTNLVSPNYITYFVPVREGNKA